MPTTPSLTPPDAALMIVFERPSQTEKERQKRVRVGVTLISSKMRQRGQREVGRDLMLSSCSEMCLRTW